MYIYENTKPVSYSSNVFMGIYFAYYWISLSLNVLLTLMIVTRLVLHKRDIQNVIGTSTGFSGLYNSLITIIVESYAPYSIACLLSLGLSIAKSRIEYVVRPALGHFQVCAPSLIPLQSLDIFHFHLIVILYR
jgi:heme exporter protein D